ncbi:hypothetical protein ILYODFUR_002294 [Ilyodon furcidens]|uniref:Uncharacterized protein n=1 Tax=Ilyodon furcidens TaxID=33524 RepID=A0ABV0TRN3_9TELE
MRCYVQSSGIDSTLTLNVHKSLVNTAFISFSVCAANHCDGLATCPGCTPPLARRLLEIGTSFPATHYGISDRKEAFASEEVFDLGDFAVGFERVISPAWHLLSSYEEIQ